MNDVPDRPLDELEREVEAALADLDASLTVEPSDGVVARVRSAVHHELNEQWMAGQSSPEPSTPALQHVRQAVRAELRRGESSNVPAHDADRARVYRMRTWYVALSAAAAVAIAIGMGLWLNGREGSQIESPVEIVKGKTHPDGRPGISEEHVGEDVDNLIETVKYAAAGSETIGTLHDDIESIEDGITQWRITSDQDVAALNRIVEEIDALLDENEESNTSTMSPTGGRVLG